MRGTILGYSDNKGVIVTDDERRFSFTGENWRETEPPVRGAQVDFVERGELADDIYLALGAARPVPPSAAPVDGMTPPPPVGPDPGQAASDALRRLGARIRAFPQGLLAVLILFTFLAISYASVGPGAFGARNFDGGLRGYPTLISFNDTLDSIRDQMALLDDRIQRQRETLAASAPLAPGAPNEFRVRQEQQLNRQQSAYSRMSWTLMLAYFFWLIPILCIAVVALKLAGKRGLAVASGVALGVISLVAAFYVMLLEGALIGLAESQFEPATEAGLAIRREIGRAIDLGVGGWLLGILGLACILVLFLRRRDAAAAPEEEAMPA